MQLVRYDEARRALQIASTVDEAKDIRDKAEALREYAKQRGDVELERHCAEIKLRAVRRIGEISRDLDKAQGFKGNQHTEVLPTNGKEHKSAVLKSAGLSTSTAHRAEKIAAIPEKRFEALLQKKAVKRQPVKYTEILHAIEKDAQEKKRKADLQRAVTMELAPGLKHGDFRELAGQIGDNSVELIFTDPPYDGESVALYSAAAQVAARILKPGGSFIAYSGQRHLPAVYAACSQHLVYWWTIAGIHRGAHQILNKLGIRCGWKPLVWYVKGTRGDVQNVLRDIVEGDREKDAHHWQQAEAEAMYYIEHLTSPHGLVVDFFLGGGTTALAAQKLGRPWIGFEVDASAAERTTARLRA